MYCRTLKQNGPWTTETAVTSQSRREAVKAEETAGPQRHRPKEGCTESTCACVRRLQGMLVSGVQMLTARCCSPRVQGANTTPYRLICMVISRDSKQCFHLRFWERALSYYNYIANNFHIRYSDTCSSKLFN